MFYKENLNEFFSLDLFRIIFYDSNYISCEVLMLVSHFARLVFVSRFYVNRPNSVGDKQTECAHCDKSMKICTSTQFDMLNKMGSGPRLFNAPKCYF